MDDVIAAVTCYCNSKACVEDLNSLPLVESTYGSEEISAMIRVLLGDRLTMSRNVKEFEELFALEVGSKYAVMVNSGSSANLLGMAVLSNHKYPNGFKRGDKVIVPVVCWSTSVWPIIQMGLEPVFVDVNVSTLNADMDEVERLVEGDKSIRGMVCVHVLGNCPDMGRLVALKERHGLLLLEDTCESLGSTYDGRYLGTFGECGTFSFYFSHHITTVEGGMVVTNDHQTYELLKCMRAHGWTRNIDASAYKGAMEKHNVSEQFCFVNMGYNLRPMEIQGAMGKVQLERLSGMNAVRKDNYARLNNAFDGDDIIAKYTRRFDVTDGCDCAWFAFPMLLTEACEKSASDVCGRLNANGIDTRPVITGNFLKQPIFSDDFYDKVDPDRFTNATRIHERGFFIGLSCFPFSEAKIQYIVNAFIGALC